MWRNVVNVDRSFIIHKKEKSQGSLTGLKWSECIFEKSIQVSESLWTGRKMGEKDWQNPGAFYIPASTHTHTKTKWNKKSVASWPVSSGIQQVSLFLVALGTAQSNKI